MSESDEEVDFEALMSEPPGGMNHGRRKAPSGAWRDLETDESFHKIARSPVVQDDITTPLRHGTLTAYNARGCRCVLCKAAIAAYRRQRRQFNRPK